ncbi:hypothetical protein B0H63DRAFT_164616 [Podospora didyma]|uniref:PPPDE domain-containing protein n=1 Tax=Podospora didyma TaxID=330526 RepID=A0AAE0NU22_9PEZI|nr:hypothetical protein B0H63DRAFT_164616 [Podospora didyma]
MATKLAARRERALTAAEEAEVTAMLEVPNGQWCPVFLEFEAMSQDPLTPEQQAAMTWRGSIERYLDKRLRPFRHCRLVVMEKRPVKDSDLRKTSWTPSTLGGDKKKGVAFDCYGDKENTTLKFATGVPWTVELKAEKLNYAVAHYEFVGWSNKKKTEIHAECRTLVSKMQVYNLWNTNCWHFASNLAMEILETSSTHFNLFLYYKSRKTMPGSLPVFDPRYAI